MNENQKRFWVCTKPNDKKEVVWNWEHNMHAGIYPEYVRFDGPYSTRQEAEQRASAYAALTDSAAKPK